MSVFEELQNVAVENRAAGALLWICFALGVAKFTTLVLSYASVLADLFVLPATNFSKYGAKKGKWAVITGASDGLGKEYSLQLARKGFNVVLVSRTQSKLDTLAKEIETKFKVSTKVLAMDVSKDVPENYTAISEVVADLPVTILINNVGVSHSIPVPFLETEEAELRNIITVNNTATLMITQAVVPRIAETVKSEHKKVRGLVLTMGSFGGLLPTPLLATYSGSKAFLQAWSSALAGELKPQGIDVELVLSYLVTSAMSKVRKTSVLIPNPKQFVFSTLKSVGKRGGAQERYGTMTPYWSHALYHWWIENTVGCFSKVANSVNYSFHKSIRVRALKKQARQAAAANKEK